MVWKQVFRLRHTSQSAQESKEGSIAKEHKLSAGAGLDVSISRARICFELICVSYSILSPFSVTLLDLPRPITLESTVQREYGSFPAARSL